MVNQTSCRLPVPCGLAGVGAATLLAMALVMGATPPAAQALKGDCGIIATNGVKPLASDCLGILQQAVSKTLCAPLDACVCDVDGSGTILASDALLCLNIAVGNPAFSLNCNCSVGCDSTTPPTCGGDCEAGWTCGVDPFDPRYCTCLSGCETDTAPTCGGDCTVEDPSTTCQVLGLAVGDFDPIELCNCIPPNFKSCENSAGTGCDGACAPGKDCGSDGSGGCICTQLPLQGLCENASAPACSGTCGYGTICDNVGGVCQCVEFSGEESCDSGTAPTCGGLCSDNHICTTEVGDNCSCVPPCDLTPAPACGGDCAEPGYVCTPAVGTVGDQSLDFCTCAPAPEPPANPCDESAFPTCGGDCPTGLTCQQSPWDDGYCTCLTFCDIDTYPGCSASCPPGSGTTCQGVTLNYPGEPAQEFCYCLPPNFTTLCANSAGTGCDGTCGENSGCASDGAGGCICVPSLVQGACGDADAPTCAGICENYGEICAFTGGGGCACIQRGAGPEPCGRAEYPICAGACANGEFCHAAVDGSCECATDTCVISEAPACGGACRDGKVCTQYTGHVGGLSLDLCDCADAPQ